jgi:hypothetical protein
MTPSNHQNNPIVPATDRQLALVGASAGSVPTIFLPSQASTTR